MLAVECLELLRGFWELIIRPTFYFTILKNKNKNTILFLAGGEADDASSLVEVPRIPTRTILTIVPLLFNIEYQILPLLGLPLVGDVWASWAPGLSRSSGHTCPFRTHGPPEPPQC